MWETRAGKLINGNLGCKGFQAMPTQPLFSQRRKDLTQEFTQQLILTAFLPMMLLGCTMTWDTTILFAILFAKTGTAATYYNRALAKNLTYGRLCQTLGFRNSLISSSDSQHHISE